MRPASEVVGYVTVPGRCGPAVVLWRVAAVLAALLPLVAPPSALAAGRVALVVGNGAYTHAGRLPNPANDASDMAAALRRLGFEVTIARDAGRTALNEALRAFTRRSATADVALVFYAGHAMEMDGVNYLLPVDARVERDTDVRYETVTLDDVLASTSGAGLRVVILDACRNNPLARSMQRTVSTRSVSNGSLGDLNEDLLGDETLVAYSAAAGTTADDGEGRNSPYTAALLAHLEEPVEIGLLFRRVREGVLTATSGRQRPHEYQSLLREHYLSGGGGGGPVAVVAGGPAGSSGAAAATAAGSSAVLAQQETVFWQSIVNSTSQADFEAYLARWPAGVYAPLARTRLVALRGAVDPPRSSSPSSSDPPDSLAAGSRSVFRDCPDCPELVVIPAGTFQMGSGRDEYESFRDERPRRQVSVKRFALGRYEVTRAEYEAFVTATGHPDGDRCRTDDGRGDWEWRSRNGASWRDPRFSQDDDHPVVCVSWEDARSYVRWLRRETGEQYRLPSEAEWEYAARAGTAMRRYWGGNDSREGRWGNWCKYANGFLGGSSRSSFEYGRRYFLGMGADWLDYADNYCDDGNSYTAPVGSYEANAFGLFDMLGNVYEWVEDCWHDGYRGAPADEVAWTVRGDCGRRVLRGGSWGELPRYVRSAARHRLSVEDRSGDAGFRVARALD